MPGVASAGVDGPNNGDYQVQNLIVSAYGIQ